MKYIKKQEPVEAIQFKDSSAETLNELIDFIGKEVTILFPDETPIATWMYGRAYLNDWVIKEDNRIVVKSNEFFKKNYIEDILNNCNSSWYKYILESQSSSTLINSVRKIPNART